MIGATGGYVADKCDSMHCQTPAASAQHPLHPPINRISDSILCHNVWKSWRCNPGFTQRDAALQVLQFTALRTAYKKDIAVLRARRLDLGTRLQVCALAAHSMSTSCRSVHSLPVAVSAGGPRWRGAHRSANLRNHARRSVPCHAWRRLSPARN